MNIGPAFRRGAFHMGQQYLSLCCVTAEEKNNQWSRKSSLT